MGLDGVELVLSVEKEFDIAIDDRDAERIITPRQLAEYVISRLGEMNSDTGKCLTQAGFYRLRSILISRFGAKRQEVRPDSLIQNFLQGNIRKQWNELQNSLGASQLPRLKCKPILANTLMWGLPLVGLALAFMAQVPAMALLGVLLMLWVVALVVADHLGDIVPTQVQTIASLITYVKIENKEEWTPDYVLQKVILITSEQLGIPMEKIHPDHHFVKDLGMG